MAEGRPAGNYLEVKVWYDETSQPITYEAVNAYTKGPFYCVYLPEELVCKHPIGKIWRVTESYGTHR